MREPKIVGIQVICGGCGGVKQPRGRSAPMSASYCNADDCPDYYSDPKPGSLWWGETDADFGFACGANATRPMTEEEIKKWKDKQDE